MIKKINIYSTDDFQQVIQDTLENLSNPLYWYIHEGSDGPELVLSEHEIDEDDLEDIADNMDEEDD